MKVKKEEQTKGNLGTGQTRLYQSNHTDHQAHVTYKKQWEDKKGEERHESMGFRNPCKDHQQSGAISRV
jgi:hypothetical protein